MFNEIELVDLMQISVALGEGIAVHSTVYLTMVSAYLIICYLIASKLSTAQIVIVNTIYVVAYTMQTIVFVGYYRYTKLIVSRINELDPSMGAGFAASIGVVYLASLFLALIFAGSIWFMWTARHTDR